MSLKPSAMDILRTMRNGKWWTVRDVLYYCPTNTPTKRLSELAREGLIEKRRSPSDPRFMEYRVKEAS